MKKFTLAQHPIALISFVLMVLSSLYWNVIATDRYVSQANVVIQTSEIAPPELSLSSMMSSGGANRSDLLLLQDYLLSVDILQALDSALNLRQHYADQQIDYLSRLSSSAAPIEDFHLYYLERVNIYLDDYSGVLRISASAFDPQVAQKMVQLLIELGEQKMNLLGQQLAQDQVAFIEKQVHGHAARLKQARKAILDYQNQEGMISPLGTIESYGALLSELNAELVKLKAKKAAMLSYLSRRSSEVIALESEIKALKEQIELENQKLTTKQGKGLNKLSAEYEDLILKAQFAQELYSSALATLETTRASAARQLKQVAVIQTPLVPEYATEPERLYNTAVFVLFILLFAIIASLVMTIIKDHRD